jgi:hypothetical protein
MGHLGKKHDVSSFRIMSDLHEWDWPPRRWQKPAFVHEIDVAPRSPNRRYQSQKPPRAFSIIPLRAVWFIAKAAIGAVLGFGIAVAMWFLAQILIVTA